MSALGAGHWGSRAPVWVAAWGIRIGLRNSHLASFVSPLLICARNSQVIRNPVQGMVRKMARGDAGPSFQDFPQCKLAGQLSQILDWGNGVSLSDTCSDILQSE